MLLGTKTTGHGAPRVGALWRLVVVPTAPLIWRSIRSAENWRVAAKGATGGFVVPSGRLTEDAKAFAEGRNVKLVDGHQLLGLIKQARASLAPRTGVAERPTSVAAPAFRTEVASSTGRPTCGARMVGRTAKWGANAAAQFCGCSTYAPCRGTGG